MPFHGMAIGWDPQDLPIEACHGIPSHEKSQCHSMGWPLVDPHEINLEAFHDIPKGVPQGHSMEWPLAVFTMSYTKSTIG